MKLPAITLIIISLLFYSCDQQADQEYAQTRALSDTVSISGLTGDEVKIVKTAGIHFKVKNVEEASRSVSALAQSMGGMIFSQHLESVEQQKKELKLSADSLLVITAATPQSNITARVPSENLEDFLYRVADLGYFTDHSRLDIDDKSLEYMANALKQKNRNAVLSATKVLNTGNSKTNTIRIKDESIQQYIANRQIDADASYSTVSLSLYQNPVIRKEVIANYVMADYQLPFGKRLSNALTAGWQYFLSFVLVLADLWVFIFLAIVGYLTYRVFLKKRVSAA